MANPTWPASLPQEPDLTGGYTDAPQDLTARSIPDVGPTISRARATAGVSVMNMNMIFTPAQLVTYKTFRKDTLSEGALPFDWVHPVTQVTETFVHLNAPVDRAIGGGNFSLNIILEQQP